MERYTQRQLKNLVDNGAAIDVTNARDASAIPENYNFIGYSVGTYGRNGMLMVGRKTGKLYAVTGRTSAVFVF